MARKGYTTIALPDELVTEIDEVIKSKKRGYTSRAELVKEGVRLILDKFISLPYNACYTSSKEIAGLSNNLYFLLCFVKAVQKKHIVQFY